MAAIHRKWNVGILILWYPILKAGAHGPMLKTLEAAFPEGLRHEVRFPSVRDGHRMEGSGLFVVNPPYGLDEEAKALTARFARLSKPARKP
jgi:23S rRNA (adenine2030-N6)-methyltransferase